MQTFGAHVVRRAAGVVQRQCLTVSQESTGKGVQPPGRSRAVTWVVPPPDGAGGAGGAVGAGGGAHLPVAVHLSSTHPGYPVHSHSDCGGGHVTLHLYHLYCAAC